MIGRLAVIVVALAMAAVAVKAATQGDDTLAYVPAVAAMAFASNLARRLNPIVRMMAMAVQGLALLVTAFVLLFAFSWAQEGASVAWFVPALVIGVVAEFLAIRHGLRTVRTMRTGA